MHTLTFTRELQAAKTDPTTGPVAAGQLLRNGTTGGMPIAMAIACSGTTFAGLVDRTNAQACGSLLGEPSGAHLLTVQHTVDYFLVLTVG